MKRISSSSGNSVALLLLTISVILLVVVLPYAAGYGDYRKTILRILYDRWFDSEATTWQHGVLVPFAVGWLVWRKQAALSVLPAQGAWHGLPIMLAALLSYFVGYKANNYYFGFAAVQTFIAGAILWLVGWRWARALSFPWLVLGMTWPLVFLEDRLGFPMRLLSVRGVEALCSVLHAPVITQGTALISASSGQDVGAWMQLQVEGACSGMNSLFALMFVALLFSYHRQPTTARRALLFALSIPLALLGNMVRIAVLIVGCRLFGQDFAVGHEQNEMTTYHLFAGLLVFVVAFAGLQTVSTWMNHRWPVTPSSTPLPVGGLQPIVS